MMHLYLDPVYRRAARLDIQLDAEAYHAAQYRLAAWWDMDHSVLTPAEVVLCRLAA
jgi:hypothetical protein